MSQDLRCENCGSKNPSTHSFCSNCGKKLANPENGGSTSILVAPIEGERRQVTIIFADISGFTALNDAAKTPAEVEQVVRLINLCLQELSKAIYEFDGRIDKYIGDAIMAVFGAPKAHEDDPERALRAALAMQDKLDKFNKEQHLSNPLGIHMGINTGTVIAGEIGAAQSRSYTVMGDAVNVASRLEHVSETGEILVSEATYNLINRLFVFEEREPVAVKGKKDPLKIFLLKSAKDLSQTQRGLSGMEAPVVGREYELNTLLEYHAKLQKRQGGIVVVSGDAGMGKSRLVREFRKKVEVRYHEDKTPPLWLLGRGLSYRQSFTNRLFVDILKSYLDLPENPDETLVKLRLEAMGDELFGPRKDEVIPFLALLLGFKLDEELATRLAGDNQYLQQRTFVAIGEWVEALVKRRPLIMVFEDLHWADAGSVKLIQYLLTLTVYNPVMVICVARPERDTSFWEIKQQSAQDYTDNFIELALWPLTDEESRQVIKHLLKVEYIPPVMEQLLLNRAGGNPLFLEELIRSLIEEGVIQPAEDGRWQITRSVTEMDIPNTLQGVLTARIDRLEESVKRVLQVAAVIGRVFPNYILAPIVNDAKVLASALHQLEAADLIELHAQEDGQPDYRFKHVLTHETAYTSLLHQQRKIIHKQIADHMARLFWQIGEKYAPIVAEHYYKSETWSRALRYLQRSAEAAIQSFANHQAVEFYSQALDVADILGTEADQEAILAIREGRAKILTQLGEPQQAIADFEAMLASAKELKDESAQMRALNGLGSLHASHYDVTHAKQYFEEALNVVRRLGNQRDIADTLIQLGDFNYNLGQLELGIKNYQEAHQISAQLNDEVRLTEAEDGLAKITLEYGEVSASLERFADIVNTRRRLGYRSGLMQSLASLLVAQTFAADYHSAEQTAEEVLELHRRSGDFYRVPFIRYYQAFGQLFQGEFDKAQENLKEGLRLAEEQKQKSLQALGMAWLGYYYLTLGLDQEGLLQAEQSMALAKELGSPLYMMRAQSILGTAYRHLDRLDEAVVELESVYARASEMRYVPDEVMALYQLVRAYMDLHQWAKVEPTLQRLTMLAQASDMREFMVRSQWLQSLVEIHHQRYDAALDILIKASDLAEQIDSRLSQYIIQIQKSYVYHISGNGPASRDAMAYAQKIQKRLVDTLPGEASRYAFLNNAHSQHLQELVQANLSPAKVKSPVGDAVQ
jgi:class 3 adenylate cyclase/predicted ATPase